MVTSTLHEVRAQLGKYNLACSCFLRHLSTRDVGYVATNPDLVCPIEFGFVPDCGAMCQMIEYAVKKKPYFIGKPEPGMVDMSVVTRMPLFFNSLINDFVPIT